jgi:hypothetical protein
MFHITRSRKRRGTAARIARLPPDTARPIARLKGVSAMWGAIALVLVVLWLVGALAFKITGAIIHLLLILAVISIVMHFVRRAKA